MLQCGDPKQDRKQHTSSSIPTHTSSQCWQYYRPKFSSHAGVCSDTILEGKNGSRRVKDQDLQMAATSMEGGNKLCICDVAGQALMSEPSHLNRTCTLPAQPPHIAVRN